MAMALVSVALVLGGCDPFWADGDHDVGIQSRGGYFYLIDNDSERLVMLDRNLTEQRSWPFSDFTAEHAVQGLTFDGASLWVSVSGSDDSIHQLDLAGGDTISVVRSLVAPPAGQGTVRDIAWDGQFLWVLNSGSATYAFPPEIFKLDPADGAVLGRYPLPSGEPRGMCFVGPNQDAYGSGALEGCYYTDKDDDAIYVFETARLIFHEGFPAPVGPRGVNYVYPVGLAFDGQDFWSTNSSGDADYLFQLDSAGAVKQRIDPPYGQMGALVWAEADLSVPAAPVVRQVAPNTGGPSAHKTVSVIGAGFRVGLTVDFGVGVAVDSLAVVSSSEVTVHLTVDPAADIGARDVTVTNPDGKTGVGTGLFHVVEVDPSTGYLWLVDSDADLLYRYSINERIFVAAYPTGPVAPGGSVQGLAFDGTHLWLAAAGTDDKIAMIDTTGGTLSVLQSFVAPPNGTGTVRDMAFDGIDLWVPNDGSDSIYRMSTGEGDVLETISAPGLEIRGTTWANGRLYGNDKDTDLVYVWDSGSSTWSSVFETPTPPGGTTSNRWFTGMTWDGVSFWMCNSTAEFDYIFQVAPDGTVLQTVKVPGPVSAAPSGLAFSQN
jgi:sugar lactone lactonase YvrE